MSNNMKSKKGQGLGRGLTNYGDRDFSLYLRRSFASSMGYSKEMLERPIVGIANSASGFNNCHRHFPEMIEAVKRGVLAAGGLIAVGTPITERPPAQIPACAINALGSYLG